MDFITWLASIEGAIIWNGAWLAVTLTACAILDW